MAVAVRDGSRTETRNGNYCAWHYHHIRLHDQRRRLWNYLCLRCSKSSVVGVSSDGYNRLPQKHM